ncbi:hypothetical protein, conserved [Eimeria maxima]|uniref:Transmembrane protein n=1 Tax=Eimeria maxima TaxID=5804 RepID=U6M4J4_EIMMA|nr:hypothetical protein, conserved [Eimeria maxima]CDJ57998.1 hypothetical protein, conserved [Eimeria maxima]
MIKQQPELVRIEEGEVRFLQAAVYDSRKNSRTAERSMRTQGALHWIRAASIALAVSFLIISCIRRAIDQQPVQNGARRRLAGLQGNGGDDGLCSGLPPSHQPERAESIHSHQDEHGVPMETGGEGQEREGESLLEAAGKEGEKQRVEPLGGATVEERKLQQQGESMGETAAGEAEQQHGESIDEAERGEIQKKQDEPMEVGGSSEDSQDERRETSVSTPTPDEVEKGAMSPKYPESPATGEPAPGPSRVSGKRKAKTKHLEPPRPILPPPEEEEEYVARTVPRAPKAPRYPRLSREEDPDEDEVPTYRWPTGLLYDIDPSKLTAGMTHQTGVAGIKPEAQTKPDSRKRQPKTNDPKKQSVKLKTLTSILEKSVQTADEVFSSGGEENTTSARWLVGEVVQALTVQVDVAREEAQTTSSELEVEELCALADAAMLAAQEWVLSHGGPTEESQPVQRGRHHEEQRSKVAVRMLVLALADQRIRRQSVLFREAVSDQARGELMKFEAMAKPLIASTGSMRENLRSEKQHAAARMLDALLDAVKESTAEATALLSSYSILGAALKLPSPAEIVRELLDNLGTATFRVKTWLTQLAYGADSNAQKAVQKEIMVCRRLLKEARLLLQKGGLKMRQLQRLANAAFTLQDSLDLLRAVLESTRL